MLRLASVTVTTPDLQDEAEIIIQRTLQLKEPRGRSTPDHQAPSECHQGSMPDGASRPRSRTELGRLQAEVAGQGEVLKRLDSAGYQIVAAFNDATLRIEREVQEVRDGMSSLQKDLDLHRTKSETSEDEISKIKTQLLETWQTSEDTRFKKLEEAIMAAKTTIIEVRKEVGAQLGSTNQTTSTESTAVGSSLEETRRELQTLREELREVHNAAREGMAAAQGYASEVRLLRSEVKQLREESAAVPSLGDNAFPAQELEILTNNIHKIGSRANQVDGLQMEVQLLKGRVQRLEGFPGPEHRPAPGAGNAKYLHSVAVREERPPSVHFGEAPMLAKRPAPADWPTFSEKLLRSSPPPPPSSVDKDSAVPHNVRLTKSGAVDKRSFRKSGQLQGR